MATLDVTELDFDTIKTNLKNYLNTTAEFKDYDFEGSNLSTLLDVLAYNTYYNGFYLNMVANEMFLDTALLRESVISKSKELNYLPRSAKSAMATVSLSIDVTGNPASVTVPKGTTFTTEIGGISYTFSTQISYTALPVSGSYQVSNVELFEGEILSYTFSAYDENNPTRLVVPNNNVDISTLVVSLQNSISDLTTNRYKQVTSLFDLSPSSLVYFVQPFTGNQYEVVFGDDVFGKKIQTGNIVTVEYLASDGEEPNGADTFTYSSGIPTASSVTVTTVTNASGGLLEENVESIKFNAPRHFQAQERAVTVLDYKSIIEQKFPQLSSVRAYGGEEVDPPQFGKVFVAIRPSGADKATDSLKDQINDYLKGRSVLSIAPELVDPNIVHLGLTYNVTYDPNKTRQSSDDLADIVKEEIIQFGQTDLNQFNKPLRASKLAATIDAIDTSITGSSGSINIIKRLLPTLNEENSFRIEFNNALRGAAETPSVFSTEIIFNNQSAFIKDDGKGTLFIFNFNAEGDEVKLNPNVGSVNYETGLVLINRLNISNYGGLFLEIKAVPGSFDIVPTKNQILDIESRDVITSAIVDNTVS